MSKISKAVSEMNTENILRKSETVKNFMGGDSYKVDPLTTLRMVTASSIFGEPSYYCGTSLPKKSKGSSTAWAYGCASNNIGKEVLDLLIENNVLTFKTGMMADIDTAVQMERVIDEALDYDFRGTLEWAVFLRRQYMIRLNPQIIMVRASIHPKRKEYTAEFNGAFAKINNLVMSRADDALSQMAYYLYKNNGSKANIPNILKKSWASKLSKLSRYEVSKYKNHEIGMINGVRICHAKGEVIDELMRTGKVEVTTQEKTWENLRSSGMSWSDVFRTADMGHMALLRNLRGFFSEVTDIELCGEYLEKLKHGVLSGKQLPFRYYAAYCAIESCANLENKMMILRALEECINISIRSMPRVKGKTMCLSDNSGSAWGALTTEYGTVRVAEIDNLSSVILAMCSDEGYVGKFGDTIKVFPISKQRGVLEQTKEISEERDYDVGGGTEGGIWEFFRDAINNKEHWDNVFIYSDQQAGTGGLYGTSLHATQYGDKYGCRGGYINVFKLILDYRKRINPKVNVFSVQTAGYDNMVIPNYAYRTNIMYGWTGKEAIFADIMTSEWDKYDEAKENAKRNKKNQE